MTTVKYVRTPEEKWEVAERKLAELRTELAWHHRQRKAAERAAQMVLKEIQEIRRTYVGL